GGWRYAPGKDSDTSVTSWVVMALQTARMAGLEVPAETLTRVDAYLDKASSAGGSQYGYQPGSASSETLSAAGLLCRQYLGWKQDDPRLLKGADVLLANDLPDYNDRSVYYWYYATQMFHHLEGDRWKKWNGAMRDMLVRGQDKSGVNAGSWSPEGDKWGELGGRLYETALSIYILEVYYRHLPMYATIEKMDRAPIVDPAPIGDAGSGESKDPAVSDALAEKKAASKLRLAKLLLNNKSVARRRLQDVIDEFPKTEAARQAAKLLAELK
ncbi:MAG: hypothetical protein N2C14_16690, partial [Planctomycetales bacterium]